jgi:hypothetical protein
MAALAAVILVMSSGNVTPDEQTALLAAQVGLDAMALQGAVNTTGVAPAAYLLHEGLLEPPEAKATPAPAQRGSVWDLLAACESGGNWASASNPIYKGGLQFDQQTWAAYGGRAYASRADYASREQQIAVAEKLRAARGFAPWPVCRRVVGL